MAVMKHKEVIHSGHFMVSDFEPDVEDEEDLTEPPMTKDDAGSDVKPLIKSIEEERKEEAAQGNGKNNQVNKTFNSWALIACLLCIFGTLKYLRM